MVIQSKAWSTDPEWGPKVEIFKIDDEERQMLPEGVPDVVEPDFFKKQDREKVVKNINKLKGYMNDGEGQWWDTFLLDPETALDEQQGWYLHELQPIDTSAGNTSTIHNDQDMCSPLHLLMQKEREVTNLSNTPRRREPIGVPENSNSPKVVAQKGWMTLYEVDGDPYIGRMEEFGTSTVTLVQFCRNGDVWSPVTIGEDFFIQTVSKDCLMENPFQLTKGNRLPAKVDKAFKLLLS